MGARGDLLELIERAPGPLSSLEGRLWQWIHRARSEEARSRAAPRASFSSFGVPAGVLAAETRETVSRVSLVLPDRWRIETDGRLDLSDGATRWIGSPGRLTAHDGEAPALAGTQLHRLLRPAFLLGILSFGDPVEAEVAGRRAWRTGAVVVPDVPHRGPMLAALLFGGLEHTFWFDADTGLVLRHAGSVDGQPSAVTEFWEVAVDVEVPSERFHPGPGTEVEPATVPRLRLAEARGADLTGVDRSIPGALRRAVFGSPGGRSGAPGSPTHRRAAHRPFGAPPPDEGTARAAVVEAFTRLGQVGADGTSLPHVHDGAGLAGPLAQARQRLPDPDSSAFGVVVDDVLFLSPDQAVVWFTVTVDGRRSPLVDGREGRAVRVDGTWLVEHATFAGLMAFAGVPMPPPPDDDHPGG